MKYKLGFKQTVTSKGILRLIIVSNLIYLCKTKIIMGCLRVLLAIICPPLAVVDKGCGSVIIVLILTVLGWIPGILAALIILNGSK